MSRHRATRFIIDRIDRKLGDVEKEIAFDKNVLRGCLGVIALEIILLALNLISVNSFFEIPAIIGAILAALCLFFIIPVMVEELIDDQKKKKELKAKENEETEQSIIET